MSKFKKYLIEEKAQMKQQSDYFESAYLISEKASKSKDEYIVNAEPGLIVAFRLCFKSTKTGEKLTKVISGKILENNQTEKKYIVETRNGLKYGVPYRAVVWVKTGNRWPKGVYEEMKQGSVRVLEEDEDAVLDFNEAVVDDLEVDIVSEG